MLENAWHAMLFNAILIFAIRKTILDELLSRFFRYHYLDICTTYVYYLLTYLLRNWIMIFFYCSFLLALLPRADKAVNSFATNCLHIVSASADVSRLISRSLVIAPFKQFSRQTDFKKFYLECTRLHLFQPRKTYRANRNTNIFVFLLCDNIRATISLVLNNSSFKYSHRWKFGINKIRNSERTW